MTFRDLIDSPIAYHRCFVAIAGSVSGAVFLSQVCYWSKRTKREDGFFYKTAEEWEQETGIPQRTQDRIRTALRLKGILIEKLIGVPATLYFKLDVEALLNLFPDSPSGETEIRQVANHIDSPSGETISRITTENTLEETANSENLENQPCSRCGAIGRHRCGGYKSQKQQERDRRRASQPKFTPERELRPAYRERPAPTPESSDLDDDYPRL